MVPATSPKISRVPGYSGYPLFTKLLRIRGCHPSRQRFPSPVLLLFVIRMKVRYPERAVTRSVWARPSSIASTKGFTIVFSSSGYLDVSVHRVRSYDKVPRLPRGGSPHSDIHGSKPVCGSPWLFAAYRVFRRFLKPRHPPSALDYFLYSFTRTSSSVRDCSVSRVKDLMSRAACVSSSLSAFCRTSWRITESNR